jgi:23S rRNA pseudouridine1911/1915/1917 synthase
MTEAPAILFENEDVLVIAKPAGMIVHEDGRSDATTVVDWFLARCPEARTVGEAQQSQTGEPLLRSGVVHRLDRDTSGVMILAKHQDAFTHLKAEFQERRAEKEYRAFVYGAMRERWGTIDRPIGRSASNFALRSAQAGARGTLRDARTDWERIGLGQYEGELFSYVKLLPKTGRMHQLRVHLKSIDRPIVGDTLYAPSYMARSNNLGLNRLALHAHILELTLPGGGRERFIAPVPHDFEEAAERIAEPESVW